MRRFDITPSRALGQNFVIDPNTVRRMGKLSGAGPGDRVIEVGAGLGSLTLALAETGASVTAVEADRRLVPALRCAIAESGLGPPAVEVIEGDARALDWDSVLAGADRWLMVSNLPYNLAVPLVLDLLRGAGAVAAMVVMVQKEVGERLAAPPGARGRGIPSVLVESYGSARVVAPVPASVFFPRPPGRIGDRPGGPGRAGDRRRPPGPPRAGGQGRLRPAAQDAAPVAGHDGRPRRL